MRNYHSIRTHQRQVLLGAASVATVGWLAVAASATTYNWGSSGSGGVWSTPTNWSPSSSVAGPTTGDTAVLGDATANRTVFYDTGASGSLGTLDFTQTDPYLNMLDMNKGLAITNGVTLSASAGGMSEIFIDPAVPSTASTTTNLKTPAVTLNAGGELEMSNYAVSTNNYSAQTELVGNLVVTGGAFYIDQGVMPTTYYGTGNGPLLTTTVTGSLTMSSGQISFGANDPTTGNAFPLYTTSGYTATKNDRLTIEGNLTITGGTFVAGYGTDQLLLGGTTNSISGLSGAITPQVALFQQGSATAESLTTSSNLTGGGLSMGYKGSGGGITFSVGSGSSATLQISKITFSDHQSSTVETLQLTSDISSTNTLIDAGGDSSLAKTFAIDTNGHTLDLTGADTQEKLFNTASGTTIWSLTNSAGSAAPGTIKATSFDLSAPTGGSSVGSYVNLVATGGGGQTNTLSNTSGGTIDAASTFTYAGTATTSNYDNLVSSRTVGNVVVQTGALELGSAITTAAPSTVTVDAGATLNLNGYALNTNSLTDNGSMITGGTLTLASGEMLKGSGSVLGDLVIAAGSTLSPGDTPGTISNTGNVTYAGGGTYQWEVNNATGTAGTDPGWSIQVISGTLDITATSGSPFIINVTSLSGDSAGVSANFNPADNYVWTIATAGGGINGFAADAFSVNTAAFANTFDGSFAVSVSGNSLNLTYTAAAIPEPAAGSSMAFLGVMAIGLLVRRRKVR